MRSRFPCDGLPAFREEDQTLSMMFTTLSFLVSGVILAYYDRLIFAVFLAGSFLYGIWIAAFLQRGKRYGLKNGISSGRPFHQDRGITW